MAGNDMRPQMRRRYFRELALEITRRRKDNKNSTEVTSRAKRRKNSFYIVGFFWIKINKKICACRDI